MAQESPKNSAAEIPVTSNGEVDDSHEHGFNRVRTLLSLNTKTHDKPFSAEMKVIEFIHNIGICS